MSATQLTDPFYYLNNFQTMLATLDSRDGDLLAGDEQDFIRNFPHLPQPTRALLVRMVMRKGPLFRASRLVYSEIGDVAKAITPLVDLLWVEDRPRLTVEELFRLVTKADAARCLALPGCLTSIPKAALLASVREKYPEPRCFDQWCNPSTEGVYRLQVDSLCNRLRLMFFGNFHQGLTEFVLADLGVFRYENITLSAGSRPFRTRRQVDDFHRLYRCRELLHDGADLTDIEAALPDRIADCEWLEDRREKLRFQIARAHERAGATSKAAAIYATCAHPEARVRAGRIQNSGSGLMRRRMLRESSRAPEFVLEIHKADSNRSVERAVLDHLVAASAEETRVHYVENGLINTLFGLLCWPAVFAPVPGAFFHHFHHGPADLSSARFVAHREREFAQCFAELRCGAYKHTIRRRFVEKAGICAPFVAWGLIDEQLLDTALECFPADHLKHWFDWIALDVRENRSGFPDLVQFWPRAAKYRLIEVKGPGDRLQANQRRCLKFCLGHDMPVSVCHVRWTAAATQVG